VLAAYYSPERASDFDVFQCHKDIAAEDREALLAQREGLSSVVDDYDDSAVVASALGDFDKATELERIMLEGYLQWLEETGADAQYEIISCETPMISIFDSRDIHCHGDLIDLTILGIGILDARLQEIETGRRYFMDHKTVASLTDPYKTLRINTQLLHYHLLEMHSHYQSLDDSPTTVGAVYNMLKRVKRTARANPPFYDRLSIVHSSFEVASYLTNVIGTAYDIVSAKRLLANFVSHQAAVYPSPRSECSWDCEFFSVCSLFNDGSAAEDMLGAYYVEEDPLDRYRTATNPSTKVTDSTVED
jgi:hypothetical protein